MILAADAGHDVVLVLGTRGEEGEPVPGVLDDGEPLWQRRVAETHEAARRLGATRVEFLGYQDSGMMGEPTNDNPDCFWQADIDEASDRLAAVLRRRRCGRAHRSTTITVGTGTPTTSRSIASASLAAQKAGVTRVFESTMNRDHIRRAMAERTEEFEADLTDAAEGVTPVAEDEAERMRRATEEEFGSPEALITHAVDVSAVIDRKRSAMQAHESQIAPDSFFLAMPDEAFAGAFGTEWFIALGATRAPGEPFAPSILDES